MPDDQPQLHVGDHVTDKEDDDDATLLVVGKSPIPAKHYDIGDTTVADANPDYEPEDRVIEVVYPQRTTADVSALATYAFPRSRLALETPVHDRTDDKGGEEVAPDA